MRLKALLLALLVALLAVSAAAAKPGPPDRERGRGHDRDKVVGVGKHEAADDAEAEEAEHAEPAEAEATEDGDGEAATDDESEADEDAEAEKPVTERRGRPGRHRGHGERRAHPVHDLSCMPGKAFRLKGTLASVGADSVTLEVEKASRHGKRLVGKDVTVLVLERTRLVLEGEGKVELEELEVADEVMVVAVACKAKKSTAVKLVAKLVRGKMSDDAAAGDDETAGDPADGTDPADDSDAVAGDDETAGDADSAAGDADDSGVE